MCEVQEVVLMDTLDNLESLAKQYDQHIEIVRNKYFSIKRMLNKEYDTIYPTLRSRVLLKHYALIRTENWLKAYEE